MSQEPKVPVYRIAFVGIGRMGSPMLQCVLEAGYHATLCDPSEQATAPFLAALPDRVRLAPTPRQAAEDADVIEVAVNTNEQLLEACLGSDGVLAGARCGSIVLIHSTVSHDTLRRLGDAASKRGVHLLDAMVSGARGHLSVGNLAVMVGGDAKLAINLLRYLCMAAGQEATRLAERTGVGDAMAQLVAHTEANRYVGNSARLRMLESVPLRQREKDAEVAQKDLRAAIARADEVGVRLPSAELAMGLMHPLFGAEPLTDADTQAEQRSG